MKLPIKKDGTKFPVEVSSKSATIGEQELIMSIIRDISERKQLEKSLEYVANHDFLTKIPNRAALVNKLSIMLEYAKRNNEKLAVLFFDIDKFKHINDAYGHDAGDKVLIEVAARINSKIRKVDALGRMGGDEFIVVQSNVKSIDDIKKFIKKVMDAFIDPIEVEGKSIVINTSIGVAIFPYDATDVEALISFSDNAMYLAKKVIGNSYKIYGDIKKHP